jgi:hypothetical protein
MIQGSLAPVRISVAVTHHPARAHWIEGVVSRFSDAERRVYPVVYEDTDSRGLWHIARQAWLGYDPQADYHIVTEDDVLACSGFVGMAIEALTALTAARGETLPACFYCPRGAVAEAQARGHSWLLIDDGFWGQAQVLPTRMIEGMIEWVDRVWLPGIKNRGDARPCMFIMEQGMPVHVSVPSLVEHAGFDASLMGHAGRMGSHIRRAHRLIGKGERPDWEAGLRPGEVLYRQSASLRSYTEKYRTSLRPEYVAWVEAGREGLTYDNYLTQHVAQSAQS